MSYAFDEDSVDELITDFVAAWNERNTDLWTFLLDEEATLLDAQNKRFDGSQSVRDVLVQQCQQHELHISSIEFKAFHPNIVMADILWKSGDGAQHGTLCLVVTCGPDRWAIEWMRFGSQALLP